MLDVRKQLQEADCRITEWQALIARQKQRIAEMKKGMIDAMVVQNPFEMGYQGVRLMKALVENDQTTIKEMLPKNGQPDGDVYDTGLKVVVPDKGSPLDAKMFSDKTKFLKLSEFQAWLKEKGLTGS